MSRFHAGRATVVYLALVPDAVGRATFVVPESEPPSGALTVYPLVPPGAPPAGGDELETGGPPLTIGSTR